MLCTKNQQLLSSIQSYQIMALCLENLYVPSVDMSSIIRTNTYLKVIIILDFLKCHLSKILVLRCCNSQLVITLPAPQYLCEGEVFWSTKFIYHLLINLQLSCLADCCRNLCSDHVCPWSCIDHKMMGIGRFHMSGFSQRFPSWWVDVGTDSRNYWNNGTHIWRIWRKI